MSASSRTSGRQLPAADEIYQRALANLPGGNSRTTVFVPPRPPYAVRGQGCWIEDADGNRILDLLNNYTALIHGHARPEIVDELTRALHDGTAFGLPTEHEVALAERLKVRIPGMDSWRFTNSGSEAVMMAIRLARGVTERSKILRFQSAYHGSYDAAMQPPARGVPAGVANDIVAVPVGDAAELSAAFTEFGNELACVLFDPMPNRAGLVPAEQEFVELLRALATEHGVVLIQDEVISFRIGYGGAQSLYGVVPDVITVGKVIGGGLPVGAVGGRAEFMEHFDPRRPDPVLHPGTFTANPLTMRAGKVALDLFTQAEVDRINVAGDGLRAALTEQGWTVTGRGSLLQVKSEDPKALWWRLYEEGVLIANNGLVCLSTAVEDEQIDYALNAFDRVRNP